MINDGRSRFEWLMWEIRFIGMNRNGKMELFCDVLDEWNEC